jgi:hypothetical protein
MIPLAPLDASFVLSLSTRSSGFEPPDPPLAGDPPLGSLPKSPVENSL